MNERVLLMDNNCTVSEFYLESSQDRDFITIAERPDMAAPTGKIKETTEPLPIRKKIFKFHHFGLTKVPVYYEMKK